jgi:hypothetical protein
MGRADIATLPALTHGVRLCLHSGGRRVMACCLLPSSFFTSRLNNRPCASHAMSGQTRSPSHLAGSLFEVLALVSILAALISLVLGPFEIGGVVFDSYENATILLLLAVASGVQALYLNR